MTGPAAIMGVPAAVAFRVESGQIPPSPRQAFFLPNPSDATGKMWRSGLASERLDSMAWETMSKSWRATREEVLKRDDYTCFYCNWKPKVLTRDASPPHGNKKRRVSVLHVDHIVPRSKGGSDDPRNLITACERCNLAKYANSWRVPAAECVDCGHTIRNPWYSWADYDLGRPMCWCVKCNDRYLEDLLAGVDA